MSLSADWARVLETLDLPPEPAVLAASPDGGDDLLRALTQVRPKVRVVALDLRPSEEQSPHGPSTPGIITRAAALPGSDPDLPEDTFDLAVFDHAIDDIVIEAVTRCEGIESDGREDRGQYSPRPRALRAYWRSGDLEAAAAPELLRLLRSCLRGLRASARILFHHHVVEAHLQAGHPLDLSTEYLPLARRWIAQAGLHLREIPLDSFHPNWWMCLERCP